MNVDHDKARGNDRDARRPFAIAGARIWQLALEFAIEPLLGYQNPAGRMYTSDHIERVQHYIHIRITYTACINVGAPAHARPRHSCNI